MRLPSREFRAGGYRTVGTPFFSLKALVNGGTADRIGIVAGVAVSTSAARRNFWKRQARAVLAAKDPSRKNGGGRDLLLIILPKVKTLTKKQFREKLSHALS